MSGFLILIGGAEDRKDNKLILKKLLSFGDRIGVITSALSKDPFESYENYVSAFHEFGIKPIEIDIRTSSEANEDRHLDILDKIDTIYFTGGDQVRLSKILLGTKFLDKLRYKLRQKKINYAGTSAGAAIIGNKTIYDGDYKPFIKGAVSNCDGFGFLNDIIVDTHFLKRARVPRLIQGLILTNTNIGIGIGEDTGLIIDDGRCDVIGNGEVVFIDISKSLTNFRIVDENDRFSIENLDISYFFKNQWFHII